jgi:hypothetical protein
MALQKQQKDPTGPAIKSLTLIESPLPLIERTFKSVKPGLDREMISPSIAKKSGDN